MTKTNYIGQPTSRVDGRAKVTGGAKYAGEYNVPGLAYGVVVSSAIAKGKITAIDSSAALALDGVLQVFTHENTSGVAWFDRSYKDDIAPGGTPFRPLHSAEIFYSLQPVALVVAETFELARYASSLVHVTYDEQPHETDLKEKRAGMFAAPTGKEGYQPPPKPRGDADAAFASAPARIESDYSIPTEHHNPMEPYATTVVYGEDGKLTIYDKTQGVQNNQRYVANVFGLSADEARVISPYVGGGFGSGLRPQYQLFLAVLAARELKRSVRVTMSREQMFSFSHRPATLQNVALGATSDGWLEAIKHSAVAETSRFENHTEVVVNWSTHLYRSPNVTTDYRLSPLDEASPADMRAPGATMGVFALECAMDELAFQVGMDPLEFRLKNYSEKDLNLDQPYSSKELRACYHQGAEKFGWAKRPLTPRSMRDGDNLIGWGVATGIWDAMQGKASAQARLTRDGKLTVGSATSDIGTGTYTIMTQIAADTLGLPLEDVTFQLGDSALPMSPVEGGSWTASSIGTAVKEVCGKIGAQLLQFAQKIDGSPLANAQPGDVVFADGQMRLRSDEKRAVSIRDALRAGNVEAVEEKVTAVPNMVKQKGYTMCTHSAVFVEVMVDETLGTIRVSRVVSAIAGGRILNPKTARSQILGATVWGLSMALEEESVTDHNFGRIMNHNLAEYHIPVNADIHDIDVIFVEEHDDIVNPLGAKGLGEIGIVGVAAAVANAVFHATGKRVRDLPITLDKLL